MKSLVAFLLTCQLLGSSLFPSFGIDQSDRLFDLVQHYQQHRQTEPDLGFVDFMVMHYGANSEHQKHPTHSHHHLPTTGHGLSVFVLASLRLTPATVIQESLKAKAAFLSKADLYSFIVAFALMNPPRQ
ncbi:MULTISPECIES: hypothetical protein [unclassified Spirosoma]|uniref:hypothetical protein n=1 Tax=unclassified Spirosoma TaxID=2621999 RepID=UPI000963164C|nr:MULTISPECIES: hypothetical protein [unclassified Spirosoma]MBN8822207.1 hypothetical protein [Spirosoma sp.]OJW72474.1 MAG: hypothetical protein BGO59_15210 [Spirosoma sp. 48-14]